MLLDQKALKKPSVQLVTGLPILGDKMPGLIAKGEMFPIIISRTLSSFKYVMFLTLTDFAYCYSLLSKGIYSSN